MYSFAVNATTTIWLRMPFIGGKERRKQKKIIWLCFAVCINCAVQKAAKHSDAERISKLCRHRLEMKRQKAKLHRNVGSTRVGREWKLNEECTSVYGYIQ